MNNHKRVKDTATLVLEIFDEHDDWNARQIYDRYLVLIGDPNKAVTLNAVQKHVQTLKEQRQKILAKAIDIPWHLGINLNPKYKDCWVSPEAIPYILKVLKLIDDENYNPLTIRQASWIGQLFATLPIWQKLKKDDIKSLWAIAVHYSRLQRISELSGTDLDTTDLDKMCAHGFSSPAYFALLIHEERELLKKDGEK